MGALQLSDQVRRRLGSLLADDRPDAERLASRLRELKSAEGLPAWSAALNLLAHLSLTEPEAERILGDVLSHRDAMTRALGRDPGLRVAAIDYLSNVEKLLSNPTIVEGSVLEKTERSAITDPLTGLYNRRQFTAGLDLELRRSRRYSLRLALLMLDLDSFKSINDHQGHMVGDMALQRFGGILRRAVRDADLACRVGGEEFAVILPETDRLGAFALAERIRLRVERGFAERPIGGKAVAMTVSGGIAAYPEDGADRPSLTSRADQALYLAKSLGKNRISLYHSERRGSVRYPVRRSVRGGLSKQGGSEEPAPARPLNLSRAGVLCELEAGAPPSEAVEWTLSVRDSTGKQRSLRVPARVVRVDRRGTREGRHLVALAFDQPIPDDCLKHCVERGTVVATVERGRA